ncbi:hypothetical protein HZB88_01130 [archaeon]|nr:hypothetical protein [archaeon]
MGETTEPSYSFLIGVIIAVMILVPSGLWAYNEFNKENKIKESFDELVQNLEALKDGEEGSQILDFSEEHLIVSYEKDKIDGSCKDMKRFYEKVKINSYCTDNCLCLCKSSGALLGAIRDFDEGDCTYCYEFKDLDYEPEFYYEKCEGALFILGATALSLHFEREGDVIALCEDPPCSLQEKIAGITAGQEFMSFLSSLNDCLESKQECICEMEDIRKGYSVSFANGKILLEKENAGIIKEEQFDGSIVYEDGGSVNKIFYTDEKIVGYIFDGEASIPEYYTGWIADDKQVVPYLHKKETNVFEALCEQSYNEKYKEMKSCYETATTQEIVSENEASSAEQEGTAGTGGANAEAEA